MKLLVILTICAACWDLSRAKSNSAASQEVKVKGSPKLNSLTTTPKPENQFLGLQQQYRQQNYPQQPAHPQYQIQTQPQPQQQRLVHGQPQQLLVQPQAYHPQSAQLQLQQAAYHAQLQAQQQPQLQHVIQKAYIVPQTQHRPAAMILIAQPAFVPQNAIYNAGPQLVNYVQGNPQARYLFQGGNQVQPQQLTQTPAHSIGNYQVVSVPAQYHQNVVAIPSQVAQATHLAQPVPVAVPQPVAPQPTPLQLAQIAHLATQQYSRINPDVTHHQQAASQPVTYQSEPRTLQENLQSAGSVGSIPPIITGFENFSPEQQEKIKSQLSAYFGAPLRALPNPGLAGNSVQGGEGQGKGHSQYQSGESRVSNEEFVPSEQVKEDASASSSNLFKSHYARA